MEPIPEFDANGCLPDGVYVCDEAVFRVRFVEAFQANLRATNISPDDSAKIRLVVQTAKHYFANRKTATAGADALN